MKSKFIHILVTAAALISFPNLNFGQAPIMGTADNFVFFTTIGAVTNSGISHITGNVGTNSATSTGFGNVNGVMDDNNPASVLCSTDLQKAYHSLDTSKATFAFAGSPIGNGDTLVAGIDSIAGPNITLATTLYLNAKGNANAVFIIKIDGNFATNISSRVMLLNGALACNVFWIVKGTVSLSGNVIRGSILSNAAINVNVGDTLEGRALTISGAITITAGTGVLAYTPLGCGSIVLTGPKAPNLASANCYTIFAGIGALSNTPISHSIGDVGNDGGGAITGWTPADVTGTLHLVPDASTIQCDSDVHRAYRYLDSLPYDIELLYPTQFGNNLVLTPHTYIMKAAAIFTDTLYLDAQGDVNGVFVIQIEGGGLTTSTYARVKLINGAQSKNVYWMVQGAVNINNYSVFRGTIIVSAGAFNLVNTSVILDGRALTINGAITTQGLAATMPPGCSSGAPIIITEPLNETVCSGSSVSFGVSATGADLTYQWRKGNVNLVNGGNISGVTSDSLVINPVRVSDTSSFYNVIVSGSSGPNDTSINVSLKVNSNTTIITEPTNQTICAGNPVKFSVAATGAGLTYQWRKGSVNLINGGNISGATSDTLKINPANIADTSSKYNVVIMGTCSPNDTSIKVSLSVNPLPIVVTGPSLTICYGDTISIGGIALLNDTYKWTPNKGLSSYTVSNPMASPADTITYTLTVTNTLTGCINSDSVKINVRPVPTADITPADTVTFCHGGSITLTASSGTNYTWSTGATTQSIVVADSGKYTVGVTYANGCIDYTDPTRVFINPLPIVNAGSDKSICNGDSTSIGASATAGITYSWSPVTGLNSSIISQPNASPASTTTYILTATNKINGCNNSDTVIVTVYPQPVANAGTIKSICKRDSASIGAPPVAGITYSWSPVTGLSSGTSSQPNASPTGTTIYTLTVSNGICSNMDTVTVAVKPLPLANAGPDISICLGNGDTIGTPAIAGESYSWSPVLGLNNGLIAQPNASPTVTTTYILTVSRVASLCKNTDTVIVTVVPQPVANTGPDKSICKGDSTSLGGPPVMGVTYSWSLVTGLNSGSSSEPNASPAATTTYTLTVSNGVCSNNGTVLVTVNAQPIANAGPGKSVCLGQTTTIGTPTVIGSTYSWSPSTSLNSSTASQPNASPSVTTLYTLTVTNGSCSNTDTIIVTIIQLPIVNAGANQFLCDAGSVQIGGPAVAGDTYLWTPSMGLNSSIISQPTADPTVTTLYTLNETDTTTGCFNSSEVTVTVNSSEFYTGISPNGDGINDWWNIPMLDCYPTNTVQIINRWGSEVWSGDNYDNVNVRWAGNNMDGTALPDGTYFYIIKYNGTEKRGWVFIKR
ncbi:MAG: ice-binding family protein [Bacteroidia bacterium]